MTDKKAIVLAGPTASGKSDIALQLALELGTSIINADSRQCYVELGVAVAKPSTEALQQVRHYFINEYSFTEQITAHDFAIYCEQKVKTTLKNHNTVIVSGGTGLYLQAWMQGLSDMPKITAHIRQKSREDYKNLGLDFLLDFLTRHEDPFIQKGETRNPARVMRAYEVQLQTKKSILDYQGQSQSPERDYSILTYMLAPSMEDLQEKIHRRTHLMIERGLIAEAIDRAPYRHHKNLNTVGYSEVYEGLQNGWSEEKIEEQIALHTRQYAKRQMTWYRNKGDYTPLKPEEAKEKILASVLE